MVQRPPAAPPSVPNVATTAMPTMPTGATMPPNAMPMMPGMTGMPMTMPFPSQSQAVCSFGSGGDIKGRSMVSFWKSGKMNKKRWKMGQHLKPFLCNCNLLASLKDGTFNESEKRSQQREE